MSMIVIQHRKLPRNMLLRVKQAVDAVGGHVVGAVLNNVDVNSDSQYQYYTSYYTYYQPTNGAEQVSEPQEQEAVASSSSPYGGVDPGRAVQPGEVGQVYPHSYGEATEGPVSPFGRRSEGSDYGAAPGRYS